jgi:hypothetical protein
LSLGLLFAVKRAETERFIRCERHPHPLGQAQDRQKTQRQQG